MSSKSKYFALITSFRQSDIQIYALYRNQLINIYSFNAQYRVYNDGYDEIIHAQFQDLNNDGYDETILTIKEYRITEVEQKQQPE